MDAQDTGFEKLCELCGGVATRVKNEHGWYLGLGWNWDDNEFHMSRSVLRTGVLVCESCLGKLVGGKGKTLTKELVKRMLKRELLKADCKCLDREAEKRDNAEGN